MTNEEAIGNLTHAIRWNDMPKKEALDIAIKALEQQPCEDCVSRQAVLDGLASIAKAKAKSDEQKALIGRVMFFTEQLPPVTPQPKIGHWIKHDIDGGAYYDCSLCACIAPCTETADALLWKLSNYCPDCGAKMQEVKE